MKKSTLILILKLLPLYLFSGVILAWPWFYSQLSRQEVQAANQQYVSTVEAPIDTPLVQGTPVALEIPRLGLKLDIAPGYYYAYSQKWTLSDDKAHFATMTTPPNNKSGHTLIYGHATKQVLLPTKSLVHGDQMIITLDNGQKLEYFYTRSYQVDPTNTEIVHKQSPTPQLTLLTCDGAYFQVRRQMSFEFLRVVPGDQ